MNTSIFGIILFDTMNVHQACAGPEDIEYDPNEWFAALVHELIDNMVTKRRRISFNTGQPRKVEATPALLPSNKRSKVSTSNWKNQGRCFICYFPQKATDICSVFSNKRGKAIFFPHQGSVEIASKSISKSVINT